MDFLQQSFRVSYDYKVFFTEQLFHPSNATFRQFFETHRRETVPKLLFVLDEGVLRHHPTLIDEIKDYLANDLSVSLIDDFVTVPGGEAVKNDEAFFYRIIDKINNHGVDRHSYLVAIGGGSLLDVAGYAAAVSHRGVRHIRIPTTVLSQNDSGVGVKNGMNYFGKKNFLGTFAPPAAVFNDTYFLTTLSDAEWRSGTAEAVKVALIKDADFFAWLEEAALLVSRRDATAMNYLIKRCAELHLQHIAGADPFETGSSRPLDFGHWSAHKLEQLTDFLIRHGEAVAMGMALDSAYSYVTGRLSEVDLQRILSVLRQLGFALTHPLLTIDGTDSPVLVGLNEFREHLGGRLTIMLLRSIGIGEEVHDMDADTLRDAANYLAQNISTAGIQ